MRKTSSIGDEHLTRQSDIINGALLGQRVVVVGVGATGSFSVLALAKMGVTNITVYDYDEVSIENMNNQFYRKKDVGLSKVQALTNLIEDFTEVRITGYNVKFDDTIPAEEMKRVLEGAYLLCCADDMDVRRFCLDMAAAHGATVLVDPRMGAEMYSQYVVKEPSNPDNVKDYLKTLYKNEDALQVPCTAKSTIYTAISAAGLIVKTVKNVLTGEEHPKMIHWNVKLSNNAMVMFPEKQNKPEQVSEKED